ncbi:endonuclease domain-containing protein [Glycomyces sp. NPDC047010]|uniref:endonuclease domain-containing protein n=1 Tax=Glycomyces sp. NPDC047010 TaxID=3155023 RepID=UPI0033FFD08A
MRKAPRAPSIDHKTELDLAVVNQDSTGMVAGDGFAAMPEHRRAALQWRYRNAGPGWLDRAITAAAGRPCQVPSEDRMSGLEAIMDEVGSWHLCHDGSFACEHFYRLPGPIALGHGWEKAVAAVRELEATDPQGRYRPGFGVDGGWIEFERQPVLTETIDDPASIQWTLRCRSMAGLWRWPGYCGPVGKTGPLRSVLVAQFGAACQACGVHPNECIDHDHTTGIVRGLLCPYCNNNIDLCKHVFGCAFADYLNNPPAYHLGLKHPKRH